ncbi:MAG: polyamine aminopropyltransferase, partial [Myxococcales bacterium]|nr:polyamine aminopropyltransferase [Myxococcales bacterium]
RQLYSDPVIHVEQTPYQRLVLTKRSDDLRLYIDGHLQFAAKDEYRYHEALVHPVMQLAASRKRVLLLGAGDGLAAREVLADPGVERLTLVDLDPAITRLGREHHELVALNGGSLLDPRVEVVNGDAFAWLAATPGFWDVIILDFPDPHDDGLARLYSTAMYGLVEAHLSPGGVAVTQASSPYFARKAYWTVVETVRHQGLEPLPYHVYVPAFGEWGFVLMARQPLDPARLRARPDARFLTDAQIAAALAFPSDMGPVPAEPSTLDRPRVFQHYREGWKAWF